MLDEEETIAGEEEERDFSDESTIYQINTFGADYTVDGLVKRFERGDIFRPKFQRNFVWTWPQASRFIESILLGLPIPSVFLYREEATQKHLIVDGLQRLTTLNAFHKGRFPGTQRVFTLKGVKQKYEGKSLEDLDEEDKRRFEDTVIHAMIIQQIAPAEDNSAVFHIFDRLNSNGTPLQAQEIRAAVYHGTFQELIGELNNDPDWRAIFGPVHKRSKDQELILRFLALYNNRENYEKPMKSFLNEYISAYRNPKERQLDAFEDDFAETVQRAREALGDRAFRPQRSFNVAVYDALMVAIAECPDASADAIQEAYEDLIADENFLKLCSEATSDETSVKGRIEMAVEAINAAA